MTGPSPWRLPSPRGGLTSVTVSGSTTEPVGSIILLPVPGTTIQRGPETSSKSVTRDRHAKSLRQAHESAPAGRDRPDPALGHPRVRCAHREWTGAAAVRPRSDPVPPPHPRGGAEVP